HLFSFFFFFFQAEDGIRDGHVTGVQTCALPISSRSFLFSAPGSIVSNPFMSRIWRISLLKRVNRAIASLERRLDPTFFLLKIWRSEERRVGKECKLWRAAVHEMKIGKNSDQTRE